MICKSCSLQVEEIANALTSGCKNCGNRVFSSQSISEKIGLDSNSIVEKLDVDVKILGKGVFKLNIESVSKKASSSHPLIIQDRQGKFNLHFEN